MALPNAFRPGWLAFLMIFAVFLFAAPISAQELEGGWQTTAITEEMAGKSIDAVKGDCNVLTAWAYDAKKTHLPVSDRWVLLHGGGNLPAIENGMVGYGVVILTQENTKCKLTTKGYAENLQTAARLATGWNLISVSNSIVEKSFSEISNTCSVEAARVFSPEECKSADTKKDICSAENLRIIAPEEKLQAKYRGRGLIVKVSSDCTLNDETPAAVLCSEADCSAKTGCYGLAYKAYSCKNKECAEDASKARECTAEEKAAVGANLVPDLTVTLPAGRTTMKGGEKIKVMLKLKNTGNKDADVSGAKSGTSFKNIIYFYKDREYGDEVIEKVSADYSLAEKILAYGLPAVAIPEREVTIPADFSGTLVIAGAVDTQDNFKESTLGETDNRQSKTVTVEKNTAAPNLVPVTAESVPSLEKLSATVSVTVQSVQVEVQNKGDADAVDAVNKQQFLEVHATIRQGNTVVCKQVVPDRKVVAIKKGLKEVFSVNVRSSDNANPCELKDANANYWTDVKVDPLGVVAESDKKDNEQPFQLKGPQECSELGKREGPKYCSITGGWRTQKEAGIECSHNFECKFEYCVKGKCVTEAQKEQILKIVS